MGERGDKGALLLVISGWDQAGWAREFRALDPGREVREWPEVGPGEDIAYVAAWKPPEGALAGLTGLRAIFSLGAGVDHLLADATLPDAPLVRVVDESLTGPMTQYVVLHVLLHFRRHLDYVAAQRRDEWRPLPQPPAAAVTVGILGFGVLGRDAAEKLLGLGFRVAGWSRTPKTMAGVATHAGPEGLEAFLGETDILVSLLPATAETRHLVDRAFLGRLRRDGPLGGPVYINAGRGATQVEADILAALDAGELVAASLDVFEAEPLDPGNPLWRHPRVIVTPHVAADSDIGALGRYVVEQIRRFEAGGALANVVDRGRGY